ncbi:hypothetical protein BJF93_04255 [Xaviernesmea oryzae]|uniref:Uncharacterized protein n=1 Tax=Xaviernesmea oryzae TaxID=464029 RepID=A0A1Q9AUQ3_9HYPH|nr:hypothetical protein [Xaviernesmea oryzae]OLP59134.1 hypothetical protein BJF93_04255 [Xaviernesmea oryzae]SEK85148.1 hypothetical protein SAMN04487976_104191 [Xaviernesmea oryzae]
MTSAIEYRAPSNHGDALSQRERTAPQAASTRHADAILKIIEVLVRNLPDSPLATRLALTRLIETLSKILDIPPLPKENLRDFAKRLIAAIEAMPAAARLVFEKQLGQRALVTALRMLLDTLRPDAPPVLPRPANLPLKAFEVLDRQKSAPYPAAEPAASSGAGPRGGAKPAAPASPAPRMAATATSTAALQAANSPGAPASSLPAARVQDALADAIARDAARSASSQAQAQTSASAQPHDAVGQSDAAWPAEAGKAGQGSGAPVKDGLPLLKTAIDFLSRNPETVTALMRIVTALRTQDTTSMDSVSTFGLDRDALLADALALSVDGLAFLEDGLEHPAAGQGEAMASAHSTAAKAAESRIERQAESQRATERAATLAERSTSKPAAAPETPLSIAETSGEAVETTAVILPFNRRGAMPPLVPAADAGDVDGLITALAEEAEAKGAGERADAARRRQGQAAPLDDVAGDRRQASAAAERNVLLPPTRHQDLAEIGLLRPAEHVMQDWIALAFAAAALPPKDVKPRRSDTLPAERAEALGKDDRDGQKRRDQRDENGREHSQGTPEQDEEDLAEQDLSEAYALYWRMAGFDPEERAADA